MRCQWISLLRAGLGVQLIVVAGVNQQIDDMLQERNLTPKYVGGYRITDREAMRIAIEAAGQIRTTCEQFLSKVGQGVQNPSRANLARQTCVVCPTWRRGDPLAPVAHLARLRTTGVYSSSYPFILPFLYAGGHAF